MGDTENRVIRSTAIYERKRKTLLLTLFEIGKNAIVLLHDFSKSINHRPEGGNFNNRLSPSRETPVGIDTLVLFVQVQGGYFVLAPTQDSRDGLLLNTWLVTHTLP